MSRLHCLLCCSVSASVCRSVSLSGQHMQSQLDTVLSGHHHHLQHATKSMSISYATQVLAREGRPTVDCLEQLANFESEIRYRSWHICGTSSSAATCNTLWQHSGNSMASTKAPLLLPSLFGVKQVDQRQQNQNYFDKFPFELATGERWKWRGGIVVDPTKQSID